MQASVERAGAGKSDFWRLAFAAKEKKKLFVFGHKGAIYLHDSCFQHDCLESDCMENHRRRSLPSNGNHLSTGPYCEEVEEDAATLGSRFTVRNVQDTRLPLVIFAPFQTSDLRAAILYSSNPTS